MELTARHYRTGRLVRISIGDGLIRAVDEIAGGEEDVPWVAPGLVDLQVNGFHGRDFTRPTPEAVSDVARHLLRRGVTTFLPTVITSSATGIRRALAEIAAQVHRDGLAASVVAGIHLEGPFISPKAGARGAHPRRHVRPPDWDLFLRWQDAAQGLIRIVTLAPEWPEAPAFIRKLTRAGVHAAIGHTIASQNQIAEAVEAGARLSTHLGNGCPALLPRHPNLLWDQLAEDRLWASMICDGFHLPAPVVKTILRVKGRRAFLISDVSPLAGLEPGPYRMASGQKVVLTPSGALMLAGSNQTSAHGLLAGSARTLTDGVGQLVQWNMAVLADAWDFASVLPSRFLGLPSRAGLRQGAPADLVLFRLQGESPHILQVFKAGTPITPDR